MYECGLVPVVEDGYITNRRENQDYLTYACDPGFKLKYPDNNVAKCEPAPGDNSTQLVTANWTGLEKIGCIPG